MSGAAFSVFTVQQASVYSSVSKIFFAPYVYMKKLSKKKNYNFYYFEAIEHYLHCKLSYITDL